MHTTDTFLRHFHDLTTPRPSDRELLRRFAGQRDEAAFGTLVRRHGRMVLGVCRRALGNGPDAEDAFQATFLVLATRAASGSWQDSVAGWLHGVAHHVALKARAAAARRRLRESRAPTRAAGDPLEEINGRELRGVLDEELSRLSEKYRVPLVLCYLEGATRDEAARQLGWPVGTLKSRVERGRELLRARLRRRGLALAAALSASALPADAAPPAALALETARAAVTTAAGRTSSGVASAPAVRLARAVLRGPLLTRLQGAVVLVVAAGLVAVAAGVANRPAPPATAAPPPPGPAAAAHAAPSRLDLLHDPLPAGAVARLGTVRFRHGANIDGVAFSPDGKALATSSLDNTLRVWDAATGKELRRFGRMNADRFVGQLFCVAFSPDNKTVAAAGNTQRIYLHDRQTGAELHQLAGVDQPVQALAFAPDGKVLASAGWDGAVRLWDVAAGSEVRRLQGHDREVTSVAFSPDGKLLVSGGVDHTVRLWDPATGRELRRLDGPTNTVSTVATSPDGKLVAAGGGDGVAFLWDAITGKEVRRLRADLGDEWLRGLAFAPDGRSLAAACGYYGPDWDRIHGRALIWDVGTGEVLRELAVGHTVFEAVAFAPDGKTVAAVGGHDGTVHRWEAATGKELRPAGGHQGAVGSIAFTADGHSLLTAGADEAVFSWNDAGRVRWQAPGRAVWLGADGQALILADGRDGPAVQMRDVETPREGPRFALHAGDRTAAVSPDGRTLASAGTDGVIRLWDVAAGTERRRLTGHQGRVRLLTFSADGKVLVSTGQDETTRLWDVGTGKELRRLPGQAYALDFSPDGKLLAWAGNERARPGWTLHLYDPATGKEVRDLTASTGPNRLQQARDAVMAVRFSPDGRTLAAGTQGNEVVLWEVSTRQPRATLRGHEGWIGALAFAPDGSRLASGSSDTTTLIWDLRGGPAPATPPSEEMLSALWTNLSDTDAARAYVAMQSLTASPGSSVPLLRRLLKPVPRVDGDRLARLLADLDSEQFEARERAAAELEKLGEAAELALRRAREKDPPAEVRRRLERLLDGLDASARSGEGLRAQRAVEVLERLGTPEARAVLRQVAEGAPDARLTQAAQESLRRLGRSRAAH